MLQSFRECGFASFVCFFVAVMGLMVGLVGLLLLAIKKPRFAWMVGVFSIVLGVTTLGVGLMGRSYGMTKVYAAVESADIDPSQKARILAMGTTEANQCLSIGAEFGATPFMLGLLAVGVGLSLQKKQVA